MLEERDYVGLAWRCGEGSLCPSIATGDDDVSIEPDFAALSCHGAKRRIVPTTCYMEYIPGMRLSMEDMKFMLLIWR